MKIGIDSYCYHRLFGEVYDIQDRPEKEITFEDFLDKATALEVDGLSLESCFIPKFNNEYLLAIKERLDDQHYDRVYAWGHPDGLEGGANEKAFDEMIEHIEYADKIGAKVMRVVGSSHPFRFEPHGPQLDKLTEMFSKAVAISKKYGIKLAIENHIDYNSDEILQLIQQVNSPYFGVNFDSGNFLRVLDDPIQAMEKLASHVFATHIKDLKPTASLPANEWCYFACVPTGEGLIDNQRMAQILSDNHYEGFLAVEVDFLHPDYKNQEEEVVAQSVKTLRRLTESITVAR